MGKGIVDMHIWSLKYGSNQLFSSPNGQWVADDTLVTYVWWVDDSYTNDVFKTS